MIEDLKPYSAYKESGVEQLGKVPEGWDVLAVRRFCRVFAGGTPNRNEPSYWDGGSVPWLASGDVNRRRIRSPSQFITEAGFKASSTKWIRPGSLVVALAGQGKTKGMVALVDFPTTCNQSLGVLEPSTSVANSDFLLYYLESRYGEIRGLVGDLRDGLNLEHLKGLRTPMPPIPEQAVIVRFLDHVDSRIKRFIAAKEQLIELLEEERQAIIRHAVTRSLDADISLRSSGVDWLGDVPVNWDVRRLKSLTSAITSGSRGWSQYASDEGPRFVRITNLSRDSIQLDWSDTVFLDLPERVREGEGKRTRVEADDLLISITAYIGSVAVAPNDIEEAYISQHLALCRLRATINPRWVAYVLLSPVGQIYGRLTMYGGTKQGLSLEDVGNYLVLLPPRDEQNRIVEWIDQETMSVERGIEKTRRAIMLLREFRTRLISDVVTGKLDVRKAVERLPDEPDAAADLVLDEQLEDVIA